MTRRISSIEVKNNAVYVNGRKARYTEGLISSIKPTQLIVPEGEPNAGKPYRGDAYEGTSGEYKFVLLIQKEHIFFQWNYFSTCELGEVGYGYKTGTKEFRNFKSLSDVFFEMAKTRSLCQKDPFLVEWAKSFDKLIELLVKTDKTIINHRNRAGYGWGKKRCSKRDVLFDRMELILDLLRANYELEAIRYRREKWNFEWDVYEYFAY